MNHIKRSQILVYLFVHDMLSFPLHLARGGCQKPVRQYVALCAEGVSRVVRQWPSVATFLIFQLIYRTSHFLMQ